MSSKSFFLILIFCLFSFTLISASPDLHSVEVEYNQDSWKFNKYYPITVRTYDYQMHPVDVNSINVDYVTPVWMNQSGLARIDLGVYQTQILFEPQNISSAILLVEVIDDSKVIKKELNISLVSSGFSGGFSGLMKDIPSNLSKFVRGMKDDLEIYIYILVAILGISFILLIAHAISNSDKKR